MKGAGKKIGRAAATGYICESLEKLSVLLHRSEAIQPDISQPDST